MKMKIECKRSLNRKQRKQRKSKYVTKAKRASDLDSRKNESSSRQLDIHMGLRRRTTKAAKEERVQILTKMCSLAAVRSRHASVARPPTFVPPTSSAA